MSPTGAGSLWTYSCQYCDNTFQASIQLPIFFNWKSKRGEIAEDRKAVWLWLLLIVLFCAFMYEGREGGVLIPFPRKLFFSNPSSNPTIPACVAQTEIPFPFFYCFFFMNPSHSAQNPISQPLKKGKSQLPFYPFTTLMYCNHFDVRSSDALTEKTKELMRMRPLKICDMFTIQFSF